MSRQEDQRVSGVAKGQPNYQPAGLQNNLWTQWINSDSPPILLQGISTTDNNFWTFRQRWKPVTTDTCDSGSSCVRHNAGFAESPQAPVQQVKCSESACSLAADHSLARCPAGWSEGSTWGVRRDAMTSTGSFHPKSRAWVKQEVLLAAVTQNPFFIEKKKKEISHSLNLLTLNMQTSATSYSTPMCFGSIPWFFLLILAMWWWFMMAAAFYWFICSWLILLKHRYFLYQ